MEKVLTVAIPTYNRAPYLRETLLSIFAQITPLVSVLVSDNGSEDDTLSILRNEFPDVIISGFSENQGIDLNIINCLKETKTPYIFLCSDDDLLLPKTLHAILEEIASSMPTAIALNHFCFKDHLIKKRYVPFLEEKRMAFSSGSLFFRYAGLGFLSSLIFDREKALKFTDHVQLGLECAHLDIVGRLVLSSSGPFIFLGTTSVAGRSLISPRYNALYSSFLYPKSCYDLLLKEGYLQKELHDFLIHKITHFDLPRILAKILLFSNDSILKYKQELLSATSLPLRCSLFFTLPQKPLKLLLRFLYTTTHLLRVVRSWLHQLQLKS